MAFQRPTLPELVDRIQADLVDRMDLAGNVLRKAVVYVLARVLAGAVHMLHGHLDWLARQIFPDLSDDENLVRQAGLFGLAKNPAGYAHATITATGTDTTVIPAGSVLLRADGAEYTTDEDAAIAGVDCDVAVTASLAGADGTLEAGVVLSFQSPISGIDATATVSTNDEDGTDEETTDELRVRVLERWAEPAHGGNVPDYVAWAKEVPGITRAWVTPLGLGPGTVVVRFVRDNDENPIPDSGEVTTLQAHLDEVKPAHAAVTAFAPVAEPQTFEMHVEPDTAAVRAEVQAELDDLYLRKAEPGRTMLLSEIRTAIGTAAGLTDYDLTSPAADVTHTENQLPTRSTITWT